MYHQLKKTLCAILAAALILTGSTASAASRVRFDMAEYLQSVYFIEQYDDTWQHTAYLYNGDKFKRTGCAPSSVTNALSIAFGVESSGTASQLLKDVMQLLCGNRKPSESVIDLSFFVNMQAEQGKATWDKLYVRKTMTELLAAYGGDVIYTEDRFTADEALEAMDKEVPAMLMSRVALGDTWDWLADVTETLHDAGHDNALLIYCNAGTGPERYNGPFRLGEYGHYVTLCIPVGDFYEQGIVYMIDSVPRAIVKHETGYTSTYYFAGTTAAAKRDCAAFNEHFNAERIKRTVVRFTMNEDTLKQIADVRSDTTLADGTRRVALTSTIAEVMSNLQVYGEGLCILKLLTY